MSVNRNVSGTVSPRKRSDLETHRVLDEVVIYEPEREMAFGLNLSAAAIWELCNGARTTTDIARELAGEFGCESNELFDDVTRTVQELQDLGLLTSGTQQTNPLPDEDHP